MKKFLALLITVVLLSTVLLHIGAAASETNTNAVYRVYGSDRYKTSTAIADMLMEYVRVDKFHSIIIASGTNFPDALAGSYLAAVTGSPIILTSENHSIDMEWFSANVSDTADVYILGGTSAVPESAEAQLQGYRVTRLAGNNRYETNLIILRKAIEFGASSTDILVCTGTNFADSLSASATGKALLLVGNALNDDQKAFLDSVGCENIYILGGTSAVNADAEMDLTAYGSVTRISGDDRYKTSVKVAERFFPDADSAVLAYAYNFPDGLCGGPLVYSMNAPLILTRSGNEAEAVEFTTGADIRSGVVLGGSGLISDDTANMIFDASEITVYEKGQVVPTCEHNNTNTETVDATCLSDGYTKVTCADCGTEISYTSIPANDNHEYETIRMSDAVKACADNGDYYYGEFAGFTDWNVNACSKCTYIEIGTLVFAYTEYEAALIMLEYVNDLRASVYGSHDYDLVLDDTLIELANIRAEEISVNYSHYGGTFTNAGENIVNGGPNIHDQFEAWKASSGHYENMIYRDYKYFGYALYKASEPESTAGIYGVQLFWDQDSKDLY